MLAATNRFDLARIAQFPALYGTLVGLIALIVLLLCVGKVPLAYNVRNLIVRWRTSLMMVIAFILVVGLMTMMMAFVNGMIALTANSGQPGNVVVFSGGANDEGFSNLALTEVTNVERTEGIAVNAEGQRLASKEVYVIANQDVPVGPGQKPRRAFVQVRGLEDPLITSTVHNLRLKPGGLWFSAAGVEEATSPDVPGGAYVQAVVGNGIAGELGMSSPEKRPLVVGETFFMADRLWKIVGILDSTGSTYDSEVWAKRQIVAERFGKDVYSSFVVRATEIDQAEKLAETLKDSKEVALTAMTEEQYFVNLQATSRVLLYAVLLVAVIMAVGGIFGVMNTMFAAISQRIKDIGVLRILGYARGHVLISFLLESMILALVGGIAGCFVGMLVDGWTAKSTVGSGPGAAKLVVLQFVVSQEVLAGGLVLALVMGLIGGLLPALRAMRMRVLETLR